MELKSKLLFLLGSLFVVMGLQAQETKTISVTFSDFTPGSQYADNERHDLGNGLVIYTTDCHFTEELRIYSSSTYNGYVISDPLPGKIIQMSFSMGYKKETLNIYGGLNNDDWELIKGIETLVTSYKDYSLNISADKGYTRFKLDVAGDNQIRIKSMSITYVVEIDKPTLSTSRPFMESMTVEMTNNTDGATIYYTTDGSNPTVDNGKVYTSPFTITETTTVKAIAFKGEYVSEVVEATYTKIIPECVLPIVTPQGGETIESATSILQHSNITITPAEYNTVTYCINEGVEATTTEAVSISADEIGDMKLTVISTCGDNRLEATYYYNVKEVKQVSAMLTSNEIKNKKDTGKGYYDGNLVVSTCGDWKGYYLSDQKNGLIQLKSDEKGYYLQSPEFPGNIISVSLTLTISNTIGRGFVIMPTTYTEKTANSSTNDNLGTGSYGGNDNPVSTVIFKEDATSFKIYATSETIYLSQIEVVYEKPMDYTLKVGSTGWSTLYLDLDATIPDGVTCYTISSIANETAALTPITTGTLPAYTGVIINATPNTQYTFRYKNSYGGSEGISNLLEGSIVGTQISGGGYVLSIYDGVVGLYAAKLTNGTFLNNANKAYLPASAVPASLQSNGLRFKVDDNTNIEYQDTTLYYNQQPTIIYDLMGRRVEHMQKGIYIVNGRKVIVP